MTAQNPDPSTYLDLRTASEDLIQAAKDKGADGVEQWLRNQPLSVLEEAKAKRYITGFNTKHHLVVLEEEIKRKRHEDLKKPHWSRSFEFYFGLAALIFGVIAARPSLIALMGYSQPKINLSPKLPAHVLPLSDKSMPLPGAASSGSAKTHPGATPVAAPPKK